MSRKPKQIFITVSLIISSVGKDKKGTETMAEDEQKIHGQHVSHSKSYSGLIHF